MPNNPNLHNLPFNASFSLAEFEHSHPDMLVDDQDTMGLDMSCPLESFGYLAPVSQGPLLHPSNNAEPMANSTSRPSDLPYSTNAINQYSKVNSIAPQGPIQGCMSCGLTAIPTNACISPNHGHHLLGMNNLGLPDNCNGLLPNNVSANLTDDVNEKRNVQKQSERSQPKIYTCKWDGCTHKRNHFRRDVDLMRHIKNIHVSPRSYPCDVPGCRMLFNRRDNLDAHARRVHQRL